VIGGGAGFTQIQNKKSRFNKEAASQYLAP